jgi:hypothetical protein
MEAGGQVCNESTIEEEEMEHASASNFLPERPRPIFNATNYINDKRLRARGVLSRCRGK